MSAVQWTLNSLVCVYFKCLQNAFSSFNFHIFFGWELFQTLQSFLRRRRRRYSLLLLASTFSASRLAGNCNLLLLSLCNISIYMYIGPISSAICCSLGYRLKNWTPGVYTCTITKLRCTTVACTGLQRHLLSFLGICSGAKLLRANAARTGCVNVLNSVYVDLCAVLHANFGYLAWFLIAVIICDVAETRIYISHRHKDARGIGRSYICIEL